MGDAPQAAPAPAEPRPLRVWPLVALAAVYWIVQFVADGTEMVMFHRFLTGVITKGVFLLLFLILWFSDGSIPKRLRFAGVGLLLGALALSKFLADPSMNGFGFIMSTVPVALTAWTLWLLLAKARPSLLGTAPLAAVLLLTFLYFDLWRWDGLDGHLHSSSSFRWSKTAEQEFLATKTVSPASTANPVAWKQKPGDWPEFRGTLRDGVVRNLRIGTKWREAPPSLVWKQRVGPGWSGIIVVDDFLVTQEQRGDNEAVVCYSADKGTELWANLEPGRFTEGIAGVGPRATPTFQNGRLYALGAAGRLTCIDASTGKTAWTRELMKTGDGPLPMWGYSASPLVIDGKVIVFIGGPKAQGVLAFDAAGGAPVWTRELGQESYSSAQGLAVGGKPQIVVQDNHQIAGLAAADGAVLWTFANADEKLIPMIQPHALADGTLLISFGAGMHLVSVREDAGKWAVQEKWASKKLKPSFSDVIVLGDHAYGMDDGVLTCVELKSGNRVWKKGRYGSGQLLLLEDQKLLLVLTEKGELALVPADPKEPEDAVLVPAIEGKTWNHPALVGDRIYLRNGTEMACYKLSPP